MQKSTPLARGVRTFVVTLASLAVGWTAIDWATDWRIGGELVALGVISALIAGGANYLLALSAAYQARVQTPLIRAITTLLYTLGSGLATFVVADVSGAAAVTFGRAVWQLVIGAIVAFVVNYLQNSAEDTAVVGQTATYRTEP